MRLKCMSSHRDIIIAVLGGSNGEVYFFKDGDKALKRSIRLDRLDTPPWNVTAVSFLDPGEDNLWGAVVTFGTSEGVVHVVECCDSNRIICECHGHTDEISCMASCPDSGWLYTGSRDGKVREWTGLLEVS